MFLLDASGQDIYALDVDFPSGSQKHSPPWHSPDWSLYATRKFSVRVGSGGGPFQQWEA
jgi:hypothetical protein